MGNLKYTDLSMWLQLIAVLTMLFCKVANKAPEIQKRLLVICATPLVSFSLLQETGSHNKQVAYLLQLLTLTAVIFTTLAAIRRKQDDVPKHVLHVHVGMPFLLATLLLELLNDVRPTAHAQLEVLQLLSLCIGAATAWWGCMKWPTSRSPLRH